MRLSPAFLGEFIGTFLLVFFGCGSVVGAVIFESFEGLFQIAAIWGIGVTIAIWITGPMSGAHLNPAITLAFAFADDFPKRKIPVYVCAQFLGAFVAAAVLYILFNPAISQFEEIRGITRGSANSVSSAKVFGEFHGDRISVLTASFAEFIGTGLLAFVIFRLVDKRRPHPLPDWFIAPAIGVTLALLISLLAPVSMAGFNPARDFAPRLFSALAGWKGLPFSANGPSWLVTYMIAPCVGAVIGGLLAQKLPAGAKG